MASGRAVAERRKRDVAVVSPNRTVVVRTDTILTALVVDCFVLMMLVLGDRNDGEGTRIIYESICRENERVCMCVSKWGEKIL